MRHNCSGHLVAMFVLGLAVVCSARTLHTANFFFPHVTVTHTTAAPAADDGDQPFTAIDSIFGPGYTGYLSTGDRVKSFQELIQPNLECDGKGGCSFRVCTIETVETECEQCSDECIQIHHASICLGHKKVCKTAKCTQSKQVCRAPGDISGGIKAAGVPIKVWFHVPVDGSNTPHWGVTEGHLHKMIDEANASLGKAGFKLVLGGIDYFRASKEDVTARQSGGTGFTKGQTRLMGDRRKGGLNDLNVWVVDARGQDWGAYSMFPYQITTGQVNACNDGIVMLAGDAFFGSPPGRISGTQLVHEMGHWLQLPHTFREDDKTSEIKQIINNNRANIAQAKQAVKSGELCAVDNDSDKLKEMLPKLVTGRDGFDQDVPLSTPHQPLPHSDPTVLALPGWDGFNNASPKDNHDAAMANYKALGCGGVGPSKLVKSCPKTQDRPDDYTNMMDYMPDACRTVFTAQQIAVMHTAYRVRQEISINGKTGKYPSMQASRCLTGA